MHVVDHNDELIHNDMCPDIPMHYQPLNMFCECNRCDYDAMYWDR